MSDEAAPTCYRHPGRETWVRCTRCDRSICPDCMRDAAVGFQCPECVREGNKTLRERRTVFGGRVGADGTLTRVIVGMNVVAFLAQQVDGKVTNDFAMVSVAVADGEYYRLLTSAFLHASFFHILMNMYALLMFGAVVEQALGRLRYAGVYLLSALGGSALSYLLHPPVSVTEGGLVPFGGVGASGAVFGLFGAYFVIARRLRSDTSQIVFFIGLNLVFGFAFPRIDNWAHIGGLLTGAALAYALAHAPRQNRDAIQAGAFAAMALVIATIVTVRTPAVRDYNPFAAGRVAVDQAGGGVGVPAAGTTVSPLPAAAVRPR